VVLGATLALIPVLILEAEATGGWHTLAVVAPEQVPAAWESVVLAAPREAARDSGERSNRGTDDCEAKMERIDAKHSASP